MKGEVYGKRDLSPTVGMTDNKKRSPKGGGRGPRSPRTPRRR